MGISIERRGPRAAVPTCPQCADERGLETTLGNERGQCALCNRFAQRVRREVLAELIETRRAEYIAIQTTIEEALAESYIDDYRARSKAAARGESVSYANR